jgi:hypothetical protein
MQRLRVVLITGFVALSGLLTSPARSANPAMDSAIGPDKKLIEFGQDAPDTAYFRQHVRQMEKVGFDGIVIVPTVKVGNKTASMKWGGWFSPQHQWTHENFQHVIDDMQAALPQRFTDNFMDMTRHVIGLDWRDGAKETLKQIDWFSDDFQVTIDNLALAAQICREAGFKGMFMDMEQYGGGTWGPWMFPFNYGYASVNGITHSFEDCQAQVRLRGRQIMEAITKQYPDITLVILPDVNTVAAITWEVGKRYNPKLTGLSGSEYALFPAFIDGMLEGAGPKVTFENGVEQSYGWTIDSQFEENGAKLLEQATSLSSVPDLFRQKMGMAYGIWIDHRGWNTQPPFYANHFTPGEFEQALHSALKHSSRYAWVWAQEAIFWPQSGGLRNAAATVPQPYLQAIADCRKPQPLDFHRDDRGASAEPNPPHAWSDRNFGDDSTFGPLSGEYSIVKTLPKKWLFYADDLDVGIGYYSAVNWDTSNWKLIPTNDYFENLGYKFNGMAWYRCDFNIPQNLEGKSVFLLFGGIAGQSHIYVNGTWIAPLKDYSNGVRAWDITPKAQYGQKNVVVVQIHNSSGPGGIYKSVKLAIRRNVSTGK